MGNCCVRCMAILALTAGISCYGPKLARAAQCAEKVFVGDFNGDGLADVIRWRDSDKKWVVYLSTGHDFVTQTWSGAWGSDGPIFVGDLNGDGKTDVFMWRDVDKTWSVNLSTGTDFAGQTWRGAWGSDGPIFVGDLNGDGKSDVFMWRDVDSIRNSTPCVEGSSTSAISSHRRTMPRRLVWLSAAPVASPAVTLVTLASHSCSVRQTSALSAKSRMPAHSLAAPGGVRVQISIENSRLRFASEARIFNVILPGLALADAMSSVTDFTGSRTSSQTPKAVSSQIRTASDPWPR
jgi:hypothetical protein